jgi:hypothetical protein
MKRSKARAEAQRAKHARRGLPPVVDRCEVCALKFRSFYEAKRHRRDAACEPPARAARGIATS